MNTPLRQPLVLLSLLATVASAAAEQGAGQRTSIPHSNTAEQGRGAAAISNESPASYYAPSITLSSNSTQAQVLFDDGLRLLLLGREDAARTCFERANAADPGSIMVLCGSMLSTLGQGKSEESEAARAKILALQESGELAPLEIEYLHAFGLLLGNERDEAAAYLRDVIAARYRADRCATLWAILLLHDGYADNGEPLPTQRQALELATAAYAREPLNPYLAYMRALVEQAAPSISDEALNAAQYAQRELNSKADEPEPSSTYLLAYLHYRRGQFAKALEHYQSIAENHTEQTLAIRAQLYAINCQQQLGQGKAAAALVKQVQNEQRHESNEIAQWELATLALRHACVQNQILNRRQIESLQKAALNAAQHASPTAAKDDEPNYLQHYAQGLVAALNARRMHQDGKRKETQLALNACERELKLLSHEAHSTQQYHQAAALQRATEALNIALTLARAKVYEESAELWLKAAKDYQRIPNMQLPPPMLTHFE